MNLHPLTEALWKLVGSIETRLENSWAADARKAAREDLALAWRDLAILKRVREESAVVVSQKVFDSRSDDPAIKVIIERLTMLAHALDQYEKFVEIKRS